MGRPKRSNRRASGFQVKQSTAVKVLATGKSVFLTGAPGSGKTHLLNRFIAYLQKRGVPHAITASTGIAATHIGGITLHSWSGMGITEEVNEDVIDHLLKKPQLKKRFEKTEVLIIDEVSMLTPGLFCAVDEILRNVRFSPEPFGGIQVVLTGDFFQLPPVQKNRDEDSIRFIWETETWKKLSPTVCYLTERHRQSEEEFITLLDEIRSGEVSSVSRNILKKCQYHTLSTEVFSTRLYTHNNDADRINAQELSLLKSPIQIFTAITEGKKAISEKILESSLVVDELYLKKDARVIFIKNNFEKGFVNGTLGTVVGFDELTNTPMVQTADGKLIYADREEWKITDEWGKVIANVIQIPLRLAWAITVHKSQGMTLDSAEIDLSKAFEPGQGYVALSRVKNIQGLRLVGWNEMALKVHKNVLVQDQQLRTFSFAVEKLFSQTILQEKYPPLSEINASEQALKTSQKLEKKVPTILKTLEFLKKGLSLAEIAKKREMTIGTIVKHLYDLKIQHALDFSVKHLLPKNTSEIREIIEKTRESEDEQDYDETGKIRLSAIFRTGKGEYSYDDIRLVLLLNEDAS